MAIKISKNRLDMVSLPIKNALTLQIGASPTSDTTATGLIVTLGAGDDFVFGDVGYVESDGTIFLAYADSTVTSPAVVMAVEAITPSLSDFFGNFLLHGIARNDAWNWTVGGIIYLSTSGGMTQTAPSGTDDVIQILGVATHADRIYFNPSLVQVVHT